MCDEKYNLTFVRLRNIGGMKDIPCIPHVPLGELCTQQSNQFVKTTIDHQSFRHLVRVGIFTENPGKGNDDKGNDEGTDKGNIEAYSKDR